MVLESRMSMTVNEAIEEVKFNMSRIGLNENTAKRVAEARDIAIKALEEIQQYRAIGTIEEFKALKEKSVVKKPLKTVVGCYKCPCCGATQMDTFFYSGYSYCHNCGQKLDWQ